MSANKFNRCEYVGFFNTARPHQSIEQQILNPRATHNIIGSVRCRNVLGGIIHDYYRAAAQAEIRAFARFFGPYGGQTLPYKNRVRQQRHFR
jgi:hypothetical protein